MALRHLLLMDSPQGGSGPDDPADLSNSSTPWNRHGGNVSAEKPHGSLLTGWNNIIAFFFRFALSNPRDALFLRQFTDETDVLDTLDLYFQFEPTLFVMYLCGIFYAIAGLICSVAYIQLRRRKYCGGDRTQDLSENMRCIVQIYNISFILTLGLVLLGIMLISASLVEMRRAYKAHGPNAYSDAITEVAEYIGNTSNSIQGNCHRRKDVFVDLEKAMTHDLEKELYNYSLKVVKYETRNLRRRSAHVSVSPTETSKNGSKVTRQTPRLELQTLPTTKEGVQEYITSHIAKRISEVYSDTFNEAGRLAHQSIAELKSFVADMAEDARRTVEGIAHISDKIVQADQWNILRTLKDNSIIYVVTILLGLGVLFVLYTGSFIMGMFYYDERLPPTKRTDASNYAGLAMITAVVASFPICAVLMLVATAIMILSLTITNYACRPFSKLVYETPDIIQQTLLDDTLAYLWSQHNRGKWFGKFLAGTVLTKCHGGRLFDVIHDDFDVALIGFLNETENIQHLLVSLAIDPRMILGKDPPGGKPTVYYEDMKKILWDGLDDIVDGFISEKMKSLVEQDKDLFQVNPYCFAAYEGYEKAFGVICNGIIRNVNAFWTALGCCLWMFLALGILAHNLSKYFLRMENYTLDGSEVESDSEFGTGASGTSGISGTSEGEGKPKAEGDAAQAEKPAEEPQSTLPKWLMKSRSRKSQIGLGGGPSRRRSSVMGQGATPDSS
ncbi:uncharacterized protein LOC135383963 [Ornithodoros turicata]|uniref:uncharacterized protein LOC135383963 n=1 Tax=Ornithodoros turicata TaxID=34597 RepID=UPI003139BC79